MSITTNRLHTDLYCRHTYMLCVGCVYPSDTNFVSIINPSPLPVLARGKP